MTGWVGVIDGRYDTEPEGMCTVAGFEHLTWIQYHLWQLKPIFHEFEDIIMAVKAGIFGPWGEMHSSTMSRDPDANTMLLNALLDAGSRFAFNFSTCGRSSWHGITLSMGPI